MAERTSPYNKFNFIVEFLDDESGGGFAEVSGLGTEITVAEYRNGNDKLNHVTKIGGMYKGNDVTFKRGIVNSAALFEWLNEVQTMGSESGAKRDITVSLMDETNETAVQSWKLIDAFPTKYTGPSLTAKDSGDVAFEELICAVGKVKPEQIA